MKAARRNVDETRVSPFRATQQEWVSASESSIWAEVPPQWCRKQSKQITNNHFVIFNAPVTGSQLAWGNRNVRQWQDIDMAGRPLCDTLPVTERPRPAAAEAVKAAAGKPAAALSARQRKQISAVREVKAAANRLVTTPEGIRGLRVACADVEAQLTQPLVDHMVIGEGITYIRGALSAVRPSDTEAIRLASDIDALFAEYIRTPGGEEPA